MKRAKAEWGTSLSEVLAKRPYGSGSKTYNLDGNTVLIHFTFTKNTELEEINEFGKQIRKVLPSNALAIFTVDGIEIKVHRPPPPAPGRLNMTFLDTMFESDEQLKQMNDLVDKLTKEGVDAHVTFQGCNIRRLYTIPQPAAFVKIQEGTLFAELPKEISLEITKAPEATLGRPIQPDVDELTVVPIAFAEIKKEK